MIKVIIESPYAGDIDRNITYARRLIHDCLVNHNQAPIASHLLYTQPGVLDDNIPEERELGIKAGLTWGDHATFTVVGTDYGITEGMKHGMARANLDGRRIVYRKIGVNPDV